MIINKNNMYGSEFWINSYNKNFIDIQIDSGLPLHWIMFNFLFKDKIIKPINNYVVNFIAKPELIINKNNIILRQKTHAEIWFEEKDNGLYLVDKCWQRQFYPSIDDFDINNKCYLSKYKFYTPWIVDCNCFIKIKCFKESPFFIIEKNINFIKQNLRHGINPYWINFNLYKNNNFIIDDGCGIIDINTPMYDIIIEDKELIEKIINEYN
jgi:hypothetical protein